MIGRKLRTNIDLLHPSITSHVENEQSRQKFNHDKHSSHRQFAVNDTVVVRNYKKNGGKWIPGTVVNQTGPLSYRVQTQTGIIRKHADQCRGSACEFDFSSSPTNFDTDVAHPIRGEGGYEKDENVNINLDQPPANVPNENVNINLDQPPANVANENVDDNIKVPSDYPVYSPNNIEQNVSNESSTTVVNQPELTENQVSPDPVVKRSSRVKKSPDYLKDFVTY